MQALAVSPREQPTVDIAFGVDAACSNSVLSRLTFTRTTWRVSCASSPIPLSFGLFSMRSFVDKEISFYIGNDN
jgi:hypothetical protein